MDADQALTVPSPERARELLAEAATLNPGPWVSHSRNAAAAAQLIAVQISGADSDVAFSMGLLHDIGRREGRTFLRHTLDGYRYLMGLGFDDAARICITHSFPMRSIDDSSTKRDLSRGEIDFIASFLTGTQYTVYDKLIQLCDGLSTTSGFCLLQVRMVDVGLRHGVNDQTAANWKERFRVKDEIEGAIGGSVYELLPGIVEDTFGWV